MNLDRAVFFLPHAQFFAVLPENRTNKTAHSLAANDTPFFPKTWRVLRGRMGVVLQHNPHPAKGCASGLRQVFGASLLTLQKGNGTGKKSEGRLAGFRRSAMCESRRSQTHPRPAGRFRKALSFKQTGKYSGKRVGLSVERQSRYWVCDRPEEPIPQRAIHYFIYNFPKFAEKELRGLLSKFWECESHMSHQETLQLVLRQRIGSCRPKKGILSPVYQER